MRTENEYGIGFFFEDEYDKRPFHVHLTGMTLHEARGWVAGWLADRATAPDAYDRVFRVIKRPIGEWSEVMGA